MNETYDRVDPVTGEVIGRGVRTVPEGPSLTKQAMKDECDINLIMKRFERTGVITHNVQREAYFADVSDVPDFAQAVEVVRKADEMFSSLPAKLRLEFDNDAAKYVAFCADPANRERMKELGLLELPPEPAVQKVEVVNPAVPPVTP